jgi:RNA polymerase sigma-70 factor (ECF subfamily)
MSNSRKYENDPTAPSLESMEVFLKSVERRALQMTKVAIGDPELAMDLVQETMLKLVEKYSSKSPKAWRPLFYRILNNKITDFYRRNAVKRKLFVTYFSDSDSDSEASDTINAVAQLRHNPDIQAQSNQRVEQLIKSLYKLPRRQQQAFMLRCWEGMSTAQTAQAMNCSDSSVKTHYSRALEALRELLEDYRDE